MSERGTPQPQARTRASTRPGWLPFWLVLATIAALFAVGVTLTALAPERAEGAVGVYEREAFVDTEIPGSPVTAGFIAPEGWLRENTGGEEAAADSADSGEGSKRVGFSTVDGDVRLVATMHGDVESVDQLLHENAPVGAGLMPITELPRTAGLEMRMLAYDLEAGAGFAQRIAVCDARASRICLLFEIAMLDPGTGPGELHPDITAVLDSVEVYS